MIIKDHIRNCFRYFYNRRKINLRIYKLIIMLDTFLIIYNFESYDSR
jgi:hypothetical protein